jgi:hypothetical protein
MDSFEHFEKRPFPVDGGVKPPVTLLEELAGRMMRVGKEHLYA